MLRTDWWRLLVVLGPATVLVVLGAAGFTGVLEAVREREDLWVADDAVLGWVVDHRTPAATTFFTVVTNGFGPYVLPVVVAVGCLVWWRLSRAWRDPLLLVGAMLLSTLVSTVLKAVVARPRPPSDSMTVAGVESSFSFPSGHTIGAATLVLVSGYLVWARHRTGRRLLVWSVTSLVVVALVGASRLYLGYHFVTDVVASVCLAVAVLGVVVGVHTWVSGGPAETVHEGERVDH
jgi:membrane-associated phospholipid phosphatase